MSEISPEDRFYINIIDFLDVLSDLIERKKVNINSAIIIIGKNYIEKLGKEEIIKMFIEASIKNDRCIWDKIIQKDIKFCIDYFIDYISHLTKLNIMDIIQDDSPEKVFYQIFSEKDELDTFWEYMKSFVRITINYLKIKRNMISDKANLIFNDREIERFQELFKKY